MRNLDNFDFAGKTVLVRCDFNLSFSDKIEAVDDYRIKASVPTIEHLLEKNAKIVLLSHFGNPEDEEKKESLVRSKLESILKRKIVLIGHYRSKEDEKRIKNGSPGDIFLLANVRKYPGEGKNDRSFAEELSRLGDAYVNDAFSVCHRSHASVVELPKILPSFAGIYLNNEVKIMSKILAQPWRPLIAIIGGAKIASKISTMGGLMELVDHLLLGGKLVNEVLMIKGIISRESSLPSDLIEKIRKIELTSPKLHLPIDAVASPKIQRKDYNRITAPGLIRKEEDIYDIGPETVNLYSQIIKNAKMIIWAGPLGRFEEKSFERGTKEIARAVSMNHEAFKVVGGGDTGAAMTTFGFRDEIDHISTGGGAMLKFLSKEELPGLKVLGFSFSENRQP